MTAALALPAVPLASDAVDRFNSTGATAFQVEGAIRNVSDTALWVAFYRAQESRRPDALFHDPYAERMAGPRGDAIVAGLPFGRSMAWSMVVRTVLMDEVILKCVARGARTVVNLGAGLDTRAFRLPLPPTLHWVDVDLPAIIDYRRECLAGSESACVHRHVAADLSDSDALDDVLALTCAGDGPVLVVSEGLLVYLTAEDVGRLAHRLLGFEAVRWWAADLITPLLQKTAGLQWGAQLSAAAAPFRFAPSDAARTFAAFGWRQTEFHSLWEESIRLNRPAPLAPWVKALGMAVPPLARDGLWRMAGVAVMERAEAPVPKFDL